MNTRRWYTKIDERWFSGVETAQLSFRAKWLGLALMHLANLAQDGGQITARGQPLGTKALQKFASMDARSFRGALDELMAARFVAKQDDCYVFTDLSRWQETAAAQRMRRYRKRNSDATSDESGGVDLESESKLEPELELDAPEQLTLVSGGEVDGVTRVIDAYLSHQQGTSIAAGGLPSTPRVARRRLPPGKMRVRCERLIRVLLTEEPRYTQEAIERAIVGYLRNPFHRGLNERGMVYDTLELIVRSRDNVERGLVYYETTDAAWAQAGSDWEAYIREIFRVKHDVIEEVVRAIREGGAMSAPNLSPTASELVKAAGGWGAVCRMSPQQLQQLGKRGSPQGYR